MKKRYQATILAVGIVSAVLTAPTSAAGPDCVNIGPNTTQCRNPGGSSQIVTSPAPSNCTAWGCGGWGYGGWGYGGWGGGLFIGI